MKDKKKGKDDTPQLDTSEMVMNDAEQLRAEIFDPQAFKNRVRKMVDLLEKDKDLKNLCFPPDVFEPALLDYFSEHQELADSMESTARNADRICGDLLQELVTPNLLENLRETFIQVLKRRKSPDERVSIIAAFHFVMLHGDPDVTLQSNPFWSMLFRRSFTAMMEPLIEQLYQEENPPDQEDREDVEVPEQEKMGDLDEDANLDALCEKVYKGIDAGYLMVHLPFHRFVQLPFSLEVLLGGPNSKQSPKAHRRISMEIFCAAADEGALTGVVDEMIEVFGKALKNARNKRERNFYDGLLTVLETCEATSNPILPSIYYEHYLYYLSGEAEEDASEIRAVYNDPRNPEVYRQYAAILRARGDKAGAERVEKVGKDAEKMGGTSN